MSATLRICHLGTSHPPDPGGIESCIQTLARAQAGLGLEVSVHRADLEPGPALTRVEADILHLHLPNPRIPLALLKAEPKVPLVVTYHRDRENPGGPRGFFRPRERLACRRARAILVTSPLYPAGSRFLKPYLDRLRVLPLGLDLSAYLEPSLSSLARSEEIRAACPGPLWLGAGPMVRDRGLLTAVRALPRVPGTLVLVGDGPARSDLEAEARRLGVADRVVFAGSRPQALDLVPYYLAADAFWFPSNTRGETFGLAQVEAMASGCPVINTGIPQSGVSWVSLHGYTGLTVPVNDPAALAAAALRLIEEPGLRTRLATAARARASEEFRDRVMAQRSLAIYRQVLGDTPPTPTPAPDFETVNHGPI